MLWTTVSRSATGGRGRPTSPLISSDPAQAPASASAGRIAGSQRRRHRHRTRPAATTTGQSTRVEPSQVRTLARLVSHGVR